MAKINNKEIYNDIDFPNLLDFLLGTQQVNGKTKSFPLQSVIQIINSVNGKNNIQFQFFNTTNELIDYTTSGSLFTDNNQTEVGNFSKLLFNKDTIFPIDISNLFTRLGELENIVLKLENPEDPNNFFNFKVVSFEDNTEYFSFTVQPYNNLYLGELINEKIYSLYFYVSSDSQDDFSKVVYFNSVNPSTATVFDLNNPPTVNDNSLKTDDDNLYIGTDASTWVYKTSTATYETKSITSNASNFFLEGTTIDAGGSKSVAIERTGTVGGAPGTAPNHFVTLSQMESLEVDDATTLTKGIIKLAGDLAGTAELPTIPALADKADLVAGKVPSSQLPSYVDDILEGYLLSNVFYLENTHTTVIPAESGKIYIDITTGQKNKEYRYSGSTYVQITNGLIATTDDVVEGSTNKYSTLSLVMAYVLTGISFASGTAITAADNILSAFGKLQKQITDLIASIGINSVDIAYVESNGIDATAQLGNSRKVFLTIDAALDSLPSTGGVIKIGLGSFLSPTPAKIKSNCKFFGSGKPITNSTITYGAVGTKPTISNPSKLVGGTILLGKVEISLKDGVEFHDLGVDSGLDYCNTYTAGVAQEALIFVQQYNTGGGLPSADGMHQLQTNSRPRTGIVVNNVSALCKTATSAVHAMLIENTLNAKISNVSTYFGVHGLVIKSLGCTVDGFDGHGHSTNGLIIKSNDYAYGQGNSITNFYITSIATNDGGGLNLVTENGANLSFNNISNGVIEYTTYGIKNDGVVEGSNLNNISIYTTLGIGVDIDADWRFSTFLNVEQRRGTTGFLVSQNVANSNMNLVSCKAYENSVRGFNLTATGTAFINLTDCLANTVLGSVIAGNIYGTIQEKGASGLTGIPQSTLGNLTATSLGVKKGASNTIGLGANVAFDNALTGVNQKQMLFQLNASNSLDLWYYSGSAFFNTGTTFKNSGIIKKKTFTVSALPTGEGGDSTYVSDALSPVSYSAVVGGGSSFVPVYHDGVSWKVG